ncbi:MAG: nicotinate-nucleotide adenylyltransferase [Clostridiales bacterium]|nr:nicotinate-nucleotide adenylyltransferase [Clostridiales bacterium]
MNRIGVLGGSFDPIHIGHLILAENACGQAGLSRVLFMPVHIQPFKQSVHVSPDDERLQMLRFAIMDNPRFGVTTVELDRGGVSYTIDSLRVIRDNAACDRIAFILGTDMFLMIEKWYKADELLREFDLVVGVRPGYRHDEAQALAQKLREAHGARIAFIGNPPVDLSSTQIRERIAAGESIRYLAPENVRRYLLVQAQEDGERFAHTKRVIELAAQMARRFGSESDVLRAMLAALLHDLRKDASGGADNNIRHGALAAEAAQKDFGVTDPDVLNAIRYHTTGRGGMSLLEKVIFLADTVEPGRAYDGIERLRTLCLEDLDRGAYTVLTELREYLRQKGYTVTKDTEEAIMDLEERIGQ